ncbi:MAG: hypothetical protein HDT32_03630 [Clostridiales bacterium]|nr:hypothetical protein [Clostridiales bacterium]
MEIKRQLKNLDVGISRLARELGISRPTLDTYIDYYENGQKIPNERYRAIFEYLFSSETESTIEFAKRFNYVKRMYLQSEKSSDSQDKEQSMRNVISDFAFDADESDEVFQFVNLLVNNSKVDLVQGIANYFNYVNGIKQYDESVVNDKEQALFSQLYRLFADYNAGKILMIEEAYKEFKDKSERIYAKKRGNSANEELLEYLQRNIPDGAQIDMEYIKKLLDKKENQ